MNNVIINGLQTMKIVINDGKGNKEETTCKIMWDGGFSASEFRKTIQEKCTAWIKRISVKHSVNRGTSLTVTVDFMSDVVGTPFKSTPIYWGGQEGSDRFKADRKLKEELKFFVDDVKVQVDKAINK